ncbi:ketoacyl-ACP synthase III [Oscillochloris sp. ZM17-4]|uniref:ketoacyl-ACP synthase III n=1 Tax=Oscillochloris sp. ZM17-4 TaxID=2866714 RepID=UPI001C734D96|nr:ketoacyl-ACP synthase III [Oscillochloris sp. ZM17-4]MBX0331143.1 ketoacyl-ACP synthase III [Oscillochloris sp. ZM17-4]
MLPVMIAGMGTYLPERVVTSAELERDWNLTPGWIMRVAGIRERRYADRETVAGMAAAAGRRALAAAGMTVSDIDLIIAASSAPQQTIPCTAAFIQRELGAPEGASACFDVNATCLSFLFAMQSAAHLLAAGSYRAALVVSSEIGGLSRNPADPASACLFGDAAAAAVLTRAPEGGASRVLWAQFATYSGGADLTAIPGGGSLHHPNDPATTPEMNMFHMDGSGVFRRAAKVLGPFVDSFLARTGWSHADVDVVVPHQASRHGVELVSTRLGFRPDQVVNNIAERGNCIAASIPLALAESLDAGRVSRGQRVMLLGTGAGLTLGALGLVF